MKNKAIDKAIEFQDIELKKLSMLSFRELAELPPRYEIISPNGLKEFNFACEIIKDEFGGLEVSVFHYFFPDEESSKIVKSITGRTDITVGESKMCRWFNILPNGNIDWPSYELEEGED